MSVVDGHVYQLSSRKNKKLMVHVDGKWIHFGDSRHGHFFDRTRLLPQSMNHFDPLRRRLYLARSKHVRDGSGRRTADDPRSANYHARRVLW